MYNCKKSHRSFARLVAGSTLLVLSVASHGAVINTAVGTPFNVPAISTFVTHGDDMDGLAITVEFVNPSGAVFTETAFLSDSGFEMGNATGTGWAVDVTGDTFFDFAWSFTNNRDQDLLSSILFEGGPGLAVFDLRTGFDAAAPFGTPNTARGTDFVTSLATDALVTATYRDIVNVDVAAAVGDIYEEVFVSFRDPNDGFLVDNGVSFRFSMDTDSDPAAFVPEPGTLLLLSVAMLGAGLRRRR